MKTPVVRANRGIRIREKASPSTQIGQGGTLEILCLTSSVRRPTPYRETRGMVDDKRISCCHEVAHASGELAALSPEVKAYDHFMRHYSLSNLTDRCFKIQLVLHSTEI